MLEVRRVVNSIFESNSFIILDNRFDYCWIVDIGDFDKILAILPKRMEIKGVLLTHTHFDHIYGINALYKANPRCRVYTSEYGKLALYDEKKNFSKYHETPFRYIGSDVKAIKDGDVLELFPGTRLTAYETAGHCPSCLSYVVEQFVFTGDSYIPGVKVVTKLPQGDKILSGSSIDKILLLAEGKDICPGHGEIVYNQSESISRL